MKQYKLEDGDIIEVGEEKLVVVEGELIEVDERDPIERRLDELEERIQRLENNANYTPYTPYTWPPNPNPWPNSPWIVDPQPGTTTPNTSPIWTVTNDLDLTDIDGLS